MKKLEEYVRSIPDFPEEGIIFRDVTSVLQDAEGLQTMRNLAANMVWMLRCIEAGKAAGIQPPHPETGARTNFIR